MLDGCIFYFPIEYWIDKHSRIHDISGILAWTEHLREHFHQHNIKCNFVLMIYHLDIQNHGPSAIMTIHILSKFCSNSNINELRFLSSPHPQSGQVCMWHAVCISPFSDGSSAYCSWRKCWTTPITRRRIDRIGQSLNCLLLDNLLATAEGDCKSSQVLNHTHNEVTDWQNWAVTELSVTRQLASHCWRRL